MSTCFRIHYDFVAQGSLSPRYQKKFFTFSICFRLVGVSHSFVHNVSKKKKNQKKDLKKANQKDAAFISQYRLKVAAAAYVSFLETGYIVWRQYLPFNPSLPPFPPKIGLFPPIFRGGGNWKWSPS